MTAAFNRRMRKTARTVVWEGAGAQSPALDPINTGAFRFGCGYAALCSLAANSLPRKQRLA
jgi:hypothetical protein